VTAAGWWMRGTTLEACNCDPICPCRRIDGVPGGRSTHGECLGALSWRIEAGEVDGVDVGGLAVVMAIRYHDDEPGSPWRWMLHVDARGSEAQREGIAGVFTGARGGTPLEQFPWAFKPSELLAVVPSEIEIDHTPGRGWFRAGGSVTVRIREPYATASTVSCVIPGHHRAGREVVAELVSSTGEPAAFELSGTCGFESSFEYRGPA
jgi:hypothetical protein